MSTALVSSLRTHVRINLNHLRKNVDLFRACIGPDTRIMPVLKGNAYGHGDVVLARFLQTKLAMDRIAVATLEEAKRLRLAAISGPIHMLGAMPPEAAFETIDYGLTPTLCYKAAVDRLNHELERRVVYKPFKVQVVIDSGMGRIGIKPQDTLRFVDYIERDGRMVVEGLFTHFASAWHDKSFTDEQLETFLKAVEPLKKERLLHVSNSAAVIRKIGTELDYVRPGISLYGLPADNLKDFLSYDFKPLLSWVAYPTMVKVLEPGHSVGYDRTYFVKQRETIATIPVGYADGFRRSLSNKGQCIRQRDTGEMCEIVGRISMDQMTVRVPDNTTDKTPFLVYTNDFAPDTSPSAIAERIGTNVHELTCAVAVRMPRLYELDNVLYCATPEGLSQPCLLHRTTVSQLSHCELQGI
eukprot:m.57232 g.57232  ORF g.57232 m.57232 type:complete len:412 (-) comp49016_c0_seq2:2187-3422(-)